MNIFEEYYKQFDNKDEMMVSKYNHSLRVEILCEMLAKELKMSNREVELAKLCGLFHDIGRFYQVSKYHTFDDLKSVDHGDIGYDIFNKEILLEKELSKKDINIIGKCIKYHNKYLLDGLKNEELIFVKIVRDADKIDILYQNAFVKKSIESNVKEMISDACKLSFNNKMQVKNIDVKTINDKILVMLAFIWDINYDYSYKMIKRNNYYNKIKEKINNKLFDDYFVQIEKLLKEK